MGELIDRFYDLMDLEHEFAGIRVLHLPFPIGSSERDQWLGCMAWAMEDIGLDLLLRERLMHSFYDTADWMINRR